MRLRPISQKHQEWSANFDISDDQTRVRGYLQRGFVRIRNFSAGIGTASMRAASPTWGSRRFQVSAGKANPSLTFEIPRAMLDWQPWFGGERPVPSETVVSVVRRDGTEITDAARKFDWQHSAKHPDSDVVRYLIVG